MAEPSHTSSGSPSPPLPEADADETPRPSRSRRQLDDAPQQDVTPRRNIKQREDSTSQASGESPDYSLEMTRRQSVGEGHAAAPQTAELIRQMENEKQLYPGASTWAAPEEKLFEILFLRQDLPMLPAHWDVDFRGVPMADSVFQTSNDYSPIIYSHSSKEFRATMALLRLIDLTASVRTTCQSGLRHKAPALIKKGISHYLSWAAEDGGYSSLHYVPNIIVENTDAGATEGDITGHIQRRMRALARVQREFLKIDRDDDFWDIDKQRLSNPHLTDVELLLDKHMPEDEEEEEEEDTEEEGWQSAPEDSAARSDDETKTPTKAGHTSLTESVEDGPTTPLSETLDASQFRRRPPVVYGIFVLRTSVFILTVDAAKGDDAYVSFHVDVHFMDRHQSVWNALTVALVVCLARDELRTRLDDFEPADMPEESDPDA
ncbi:hypothetical protein JDV02_000209 [Purpureocillium takamizusanense]|uniref:Uncharacterized protein n=1 Tax=Purpureocillium takamizusanense TaxID=2060973 RepID=A0A9Q8Q688_9HYPO|nr:uncharacterized protein JDV02_000209 [Purpureocillium takamizusanense]UNI13466.1 hypothetical protein JDV02_000209 [Purpureocillium takamizusanense]